MSFESLRYPDKNEVPRPGLYQVKNNDEVNGNGGLALRDYDSKTGVGKKSLEDVVVKIPAGTVLNVEKFVTSPSGKYLVWALVSYKYENKNRGDTYEIKGCVPLEYIEKYSTKSDLAALRQEIDSKSHEK